MEHPEETLPPEFVEPRRVREPSDALERRVDVEESNDKDVELSNNSRPANEPASPTLPIRLKSTCGSVANARVGIARIERRVGRIDDGHERYMEGEFIVGLYLLACDEQGVYARKLVAWTRSVSLELALQVVVGGSKEHNQQRFPPHPHWLTAYQGLCRDSRFEPYRCHFSATHGIVYTGSMSLKFSLR